MYTYDSFVTNGAFTLLRPIFITFIIASLLLFLFILFPKTRKKWMNGFTVVSLSLVFSIVSAQTLFYNAIIVDEIGLGGDYVSTLMCLFIVILSLMNPIIYFNLQNHKKNNIQKENF